mmetsp:Transcript_78810/g.124366  ORF Transcript_78810/g.124366 Transcript_78810/m.124366 type:complete len:738 (-) Transcript_78810:18-2231(-)
MEGVLRHVGQAQALRLPDGTLRGELFSHQDLDGCRLPRAVGADHRHAAHLTHGEADVHDGGLVLGGVGEAHVVHAQNHLTSALHTLQRARLGEHKLHGLVADLEVGLLLGIFLDELRQAGSFDALEGLQFAVLEVDDVGAHLVQERTEVRGADDGPVEGFQPIFQPLDVVHVQVPGGFIQHQHVGVHQLGSTELHLHLPAPRVAGHRQLQVGSAVGATGVAETDGLHQFLHSVFLHRWFQLVDVIAGVNHPPPARFVHRQDGKAIILHTHLFIFDLMLHEDGLQLISLGEALELLVGDGAHQRGLAALVGAQQAVETVALEVHLGIAQQGQGTVGQREGALVKVHALGVLLLDFLLGLRGDLHLGPQLLRDAVEGRQEAHIRLPLGLIEDAHVGRAGRQRRDMLQLCLEDLARALGVAEGFLHLFLGRLRRHLLQGLRAFARGLLQRLVGLLRDAARLGVRDLLRGVLHQGLQLGHQGKDLCWILHQLAHVVHDLTAGTLHLLVLVVQATGQHRDGHGQGWSLHILHEDAASQLLHAVVGLVNGGGRIHHGRKEGLQILVASAVADGRHAFQGRLLHLLLDVTGEIRHGTHEVHQQISHSPGRLLRQGRDDLQRGLLLRRLGLHGQAVEEGRQQHLHRKRGDHAHDGLTGRHRRILHILGLVIGGLQDLGKGRDQEGLSRTPLVLRNLGQRFQGRLPSCLVTNLRNQRFNLSLEFGCHRWEKSRKRTDCAFCEWKML